jgi:hypothetical protein
MLIWLLGLQALENYVLTPVVQHNAVNLSPLVVFLAVIAGLTLWGVVGAIIAVPLVAVAAVILEEILLPMRRRKVLREAREENNLALAAADATPAVGGADLEGTPAPAAPVPPGGDAGDRVGGEERAAA